MEPRDYAGLRPDTAQWVDLRGYLFSERCDVFPNPDPASGFVMRTWDFPMAMAAGAPCPEVVLAAADGTGESPTAQAGKSRTGYVLAAPESVEALGNALSSWQRRGVTLHTLPSPVETMLDRLRVSVPSGFEVRAAASGWASAGWDLSHLPGALLREYSTEGLRGRPMAAAFSDGRPVAFCYSACSTETLWDVAVDTLVDYRRLGLSEACFAVLARQLAAADLEPVWGALDENVASQRLAAKLGFVSAAPLVSFVRD